jgi:hypothetical protein
MKLSSAHWNAAVAALVAALKHHGVSEKLIGEVAAVVTPVKAFIVTV